MRNGWTLAQGPHSVPRTRGITSPKAHRAVRPGQTDSFNLNSGSAWLASSSSSFKTQLKIITSLGQISYPFPQPLEAVASHLLLIDLSVSPTGLGVPCGGGQRYPHTWHRRCIQQILIQLEFQLFFSLLSSLPLPVNISILIPLLSQIQALCFPGFQLPDPVFLKDTSSSQS